LSYQSNSPLTGIHCPSRPTVLPWAGGVRSVGLERIKLVSGLAEVPYLMAARQVTRSTVALSRAKQRAFFTYCANRSVGRYAAKSRNNIQGLYDLFVQAGVSVEGVR